MYPELFRIGNFPINTYGVFLALAFLCAILITVRLAARDGLPRERIYDLCLWMLLSSLVGSKLLMLFTEPEYRDHPGQLLSLDFLRSGGVFYGGLIGAILAGYLLMRRYQLPGGRRLTPALQESRSEISSAGKAASPPAAVGVNRPAFPGA